MRHSNLECDMAASESVEIVYFRFTKIHTWLRGLGECNKRNVLFIFEPKDDFFCVIPPSLAAKYEF